MGRSRYPPIEKTAAEGATLFRPTGFSHSEDVPLVAVKKVKYSS
jgi:hypothetical protein